MTSENVEPYALSLTAFEGRGNPIACCDESSLLPLASIGNPIAPRCLVVNRASRSRRSVVSGLPLTRSVVLSHGAWSRGVARLSVATDVTDQLVRALSVVQLCVLPRFGVCAAAAGR